LSLIDPLGDFSSLETSMSPGQKKTLAKSLGDVQRNAQSSSASMRDFHHTSLPEAISGAAIRVHKRK